MKITILGYSGSGKSTLAKQLADHYYSPLLHLDQVQFLDNWQERDKTESKRIVKEHLMQSDWVIDGNYSEFYQEQRIKEADQIILLQFSRWACLKRVFQRYLTYRNRTRPDVAANCPETINLEFLWWILYSGRTKEKRSVYENIAKNYAEKTIIICNQKELTHFYQSVLKNKEH